MKILYAPWREKYLKINETPECVFCVQAQEKNDNANFILKRFKHCYVVLNLFPYNAGHLLVVPYIHMNQLNNLGLDVQHEIIEVTSKCVGILQDQLKNTGTNVGLNLGEGAGGTIPYHIHMHILPRWISDTGFLPTLSQTKQISFDLNEIYKKLLPAFENL